MHHDLSRFSSKTLEQIPHHELLIATHGLAIELMISCALPSDISSSWEPFLVKKEEGGTEYRIFKGIIDIRILGIPLPDRLNEILISCETSREIADAVRLFELAPMIRNFAKIEKCESKVRIVMRGALNLIKLQGTMGKFFRDNIPTYKLPIGLDTEIYTNPHKRKFTKLGFRPAIQ